MHLTFLYLMLVHVTFSLMCEMSFYSHYAEKSLNKYWLEGSLGIYF